MTEKINPVPYHEKFEKPLQQTRGNVSSWILNLLNKVEFYLSIYICRNSVAHVGPTTFSIPSSCNFPVSASQQPVKYKCDALTMDGCFAAEAKP